MYFIATYAWFYGEVRFLKLMDEGDTRKGLAWACLSFVGPPLFMLGTYMMRKEKPAWWAVQFPYWGMSIGLSYFLFRHVLNTTVGWRELVSAVLIVIIAALMGTE